MQRNNDEAIAAKQLAKVVPISPLHVAEVDGLGDRSRLLRDSVTAEIVLLIILVIDVLFKLVNHFNVVDFRRH